MLKGIIFDSDGVLVDSMPYHAQAWVQVFREEGIDVRKEEIYEVEGANHVGVINTMFRKTDKKPGKDSYDSLLTKKREYFMKNSKAEPFEGMLECLQSLKGRYKLAVASGADKTIVNDLMDRFYPGIFDVRITGEDVENGKPDPEPYVKAAGKLGIDAVECMVVENAPLGVQSAKKAGMYCVAVSTYIPPEKVAGADRVFKDHSRLIDYLKGLAMSKDPDP
ncbi:HAD family phosphatase [Methanolobus sp.]|uniref:HAD family hydrolase n=1 Tax=Methanolobus sp. TaxID=1874737 RepID=UPI0025E5CDCC|nr:HAD family phosphatase [Methanolobus sp.]